MANDLEIIKKMEEEVNHPLTRLEKIDFDMGDRGYVVDGKKNVTRLGLWYKGIKDISLLSRLKNLTQLDIGSNKLSDISVLAELKNLTKLDLSRNSISDISVLGELRNLTKLDLSRNSLSEISVLGELKNLTKLNLSENSISDISALGALKNLTRLDLTANKVADIRPILKLAALRRLDLRGNRVSRLPREIIDLGIEIKWEWDGGEGIFLQDNPLESPPAEIVRKGREAVENYFRELEAKETDYLYEAKLLLVGEEKAGKSCLSEALTNPDYVFGDKGSTQGIDINRWTIAKNETGLAKDFRLNIWDFGGQEIYHSTHQFFLTKRSIYFLVSEARKDVRHEDFYYWLNIIEALGGGSPVVILQNKCDQPGVGIAVREYQDRFVNIVESPQNVSCKDEYRDTIDGLKAATKRIIKNRELLPDIGSELPKVWVDIREELERLREEGRNYIGYDEYLEVCTSFGLTEKRAMFLADYFHDLGVFLHFRDDLQLKKTIFLNFEWVTKAVYNVLDNKKVISQQGEFDRSDLENIWHEEQFREKQPELLGLMKNEKFELCFDLGGGRYLAPKLLAEDVPEELHGFEKPEELSEPLYYEFRYKFMPKGILTRLIVRLNSHIYKNMCWRYGVLLEFDKTRALVRERYFDRKITIALEGENKKELLGIIRKEVQDINSMFHNLQVREMIPCNCEKCKVSESPHYYELERLRKRIRDGKRTVECQESYENVNIYVILGDVVIIEKDKSGKQVIIKEYYAKGDRMKIGKVEISGGQVNFADRIEKIEYNEGLGIGKEELNELKEGVKGLSAEKKAKLDTQYDELRRADTEDKKKSIGKRIKDFLVKNGIEAARSLAVEAIKTILLGG
jgi:hypothetical protein